MEYLLIKDKQQVILGPMPWRARYIQSELNDLVDAGEKATAFTISPTESGYVDCGDGYELIPAIFSSTDYDPIYQHLEGPFYTYNDNVASGLYNVLETDISLVKAKLKEIAKAERQRKQNLGTTVNIGGTDVSLATDADELANFVSLLSSIGEDSVNWKFKEGFITLTKANVQSIVDAIRSHIQTQFDWEKTICETIETATELSSLKTLTITE
jgi:hypothetical protein